MSDIKFLTLVEASRFSRTPVSTLRRKIFAGELRAYKPSKGILIDPKDLERWIKSKEVSSAS